MLTFEIGPKTRGDFSRRFFFLRPLATAAALHFIGRYDLDGIRVLHLHCLGQLLGYRGEHFLNVLS